MENWHIPYSRTLGQGSYNRNNMQLQARTLLTRARTHQNSSSGRTWRARATASNWPRGRAAPERLPHAARQDVGWDSDLKRPNRTLVPPMKLTTPQAEAVVALAAVAALLGEAPAGVLAEASPAVPTILNTCPKPEEFTNPGNLVTTSLPKLQPAGPTDPRGCCRSSASAAVLVVAASAVPADVLPTTWNEFQKANKGTGWSRAMTGQKWHEHKALLHLKGGSTAAWAATEPATGAVVVAGGWRLLAVLHNVRCPPQQEQGRVPSYQPPGMSSARQTRARGTPCKSWVRCGGSTRPCTCNGHALWFDLQHSMMGWSAPLAGFHTCPLSWYHSGV